MKRKSVKFDFTDSLIDITEHAIRNEKSLSFIGVDTLDMPKKEDIKRDKAMFEGITKALETSDCVVYPVGSAHIHNNEAPDEKRLGGLLVSEEGIDLKLANLYPKNSNAYNFVNKDIEAFQTQHPSYKNEVIYPALSNIEILGKQPTELKLKSNVIRKKPEKSNKRSDKLELNIETDTEAQEKPLRRKLYQENTTTETTNPLTKSLKTKLSTDITTETVKKANKIRKDLNIHEYSPDV